MQTDSRVEATTILLAMVQEDRSLNEVLPDSAAPFTKELVYGVTRWYWRLKAAADGLLRKPLRRKDADVGLLILIGLYQLGQLRTPPHAAINETVAACEQLGKVWAKGLVNAVLRGFVRRGFELSEDCSDEARYSHPMWMLEHIRSAWPQHWQRTLAANNERAPMVLRVNRRLTKRVQYLSELEHAGVCGRADELAPQAVVLDAPMPVASIPGFSQGRVSVQDTAAQWAASMTPIGPGERVLDACAAPGGKLTHILEAYPDAGPVLAIDISEKRIRMIRDNLRRLGLNAEVLAADAADVESWWDGIQFDWVVLDAPCTGTGVIRRRPDIKHLRRLPDLARAVAAQALLLHRLWPTVAPGGRLLYITCSILPEENDSQIQSFVSGRSDVDVCEVAAPAGLECRFGLQTLPGVHGVDGFYYSMLCKREV